MTLPRSVARVGRFVVALALVGLRGAVPVAGNPVVVSNLYGRCELVTGANVPFVARTVEASFDGACAVRVADVDGDGFADIVGAAKDADAVRWWRNTDGSGTNAWEPHAVGVVNGPYAVDVADLSGDTFPDVISVVYGAGIVCYWVNADGGGSNWTYRTIATGLGGAYAVQAVDMDRDGDTDVLGAGITANSIRWWENANGLGTAWTQHVVSNNFNRPWSVYAADIDGDGDPDVISTGYSDDAVVWWENADGAGTRWVSRTVADDFALPYAVAAADLDNDGDMDIVCGAYSFAVGPKVRWWENLDGAGTAWSGHTIDTTFNNVQSIQVADVDRDGDVDVLATSQKDDSVAWWENMNGDGLQWRLRRLSSVFAGARGVAAGDINGDGETDVVGAAAGPGASVAVAWWENGFTGRLTFDPPVDTNEVAYTESARCFISTTPVVNGATQYVCAGWTGSGSVPSAGTSPNISAFVLSNASSIAWAWSTQYWFRASASSNGSVQAASGWYAVGASASASATSDPLFVFDHWDGDVPVSNAMDNPVVVTMDGARSLTAVFRPVDHVITASAGSYGSIAPSGTVGVLTGESAEFRMTPDRHYRVAELLIDDVPQPAADVYRFENVTNSHTIHATFEEARYTLTVSNVYGVTYLRPDQQTTFSERRVSTNLPATRCAIAADVDGDGWTDLASAAYDTAQITWWRNGEADGTNWIPITIASVPPGSDILRAGDLDGDEDTDFVVGGSRTNGLYWLRNDGGGTNWSVVSVTTNLAYLGDLRVADMNANAVLDLVTAWSASNTITWWHNMDATGGVWEANVISTNAPGVCSLRIVDIDGDGRRDVLAALPGAATVAWWRNASGDGSVWQRHDVSVTYWGVAGVNAADMDLDGDLDVVASSTNQATILWWENRDIDGTAWVLHTLDNSAWGTGAFELADVDGDGDVDLLGTTAAWNVTRWIENIDRGTSWQGHAVGPAYNGSPTVAIADFDRDGELDLVTIAGPLSYLLWWRNDLTGRLTLSPPVDATNFLYTTGLRCWLVPPYRRRGDSLDVCTGWRAAGSLPAAGTDTLTGSFDLEADTTLGWRWQVRHRLRTPATADGHLSVAPGWYAAGTTLVVSAVADFQHLFLAWGGDVPAEMRTANPIEIAMDAPRTIWATFIVGDHVVRAEAGEGGEVAPSGIVGVPDGADQGFELMPSPGYVVSNLLVDGVWLDPMAYARVSYTFEAVTGDHQLVVAFMPEDETTDTDGDGLPNIEERALGMNAFEPDTDGDGFGDYAEAVAGTDGTNAASFFAVSQRLTADGRIVVDWPSATGRVYTLWWRPNLVSGAWEGVVGVSNLVGTGGLVGYTNDMPAAARFFRSGVRRAGD